MCNVYFCSHRKNSELIGGVQEYEILEPQTLAGDYVQSISFKFNWTPEFREAYEKEKHAGEQMNFCSGVDATNNGTVKYPENLVVYVPEDQCSRKGDDSSSGNTLYPIAVTFIAVLLTFSLI